MLSLWWKAKVDAISKVPRPTNVNRLKAFLGVGCKLLLTICQKV
jgi:hypothetical protein